GLLSSAFPAVLLDFVRKTGLSCRLNNNHGYLDLPHAGFRALHSLADRWRCTDAAGVPVAGRDRILSGPRCHPCFPFVVYRTHRGLAAGIYRLVRRLPASVVRAAWIGAKADPGRGGT